MRVRCVETGQIFEVESINPPGWVIHPTREGNLLLCPESYVLLKNGLFAGTGVAEDFEIIPDNSEKTLMR